MKRVTFYVDGFNFYYGLRTEKRVNAEWKKVYWDRFEIPNYENQDENIVYIVGGGESDYLKLYFDNNDQIIKLEHRSEDPG